MSNSLSDSHFWYQCLILTFDNLSDSHLHQCLTPCLILTSYIMSHSHFLHQMSNSHFWHHCLIHTSDINVWFSLLTICLIPTYINVLHHVWFSLLTSCLILTFYIKCLILISDTIVWFPLLTSMSDSYFWHQCLIFTSQINMFHSSDTIIWFSPLTPMSDFHFWHKCLILTSDTMSDSHFWHQYLILTSGTNIWFSLIRMRYLKKDSGVSWVNISIVLTKQHGPEVKEVSS